MSGERDKVHLFGQLMIKFHINDQIKKGNIELARALKRDALEYLKENNLEYIWLEEVVVHE